jgi:hypothetical protein
MRLEIYDSNDLNFVELNITGGNDTYIRCDKESKYIDSSVFNVFTICFENANKLYEYYGPTKYNSRKIIPLRNELLKFLEKFKNAGTSDEFEQFLSSSFSGKEFIEELEKDKKDWKSDWNTVLNKLIEINQQLVSLTEKCADEERILWVVGY